MTVPDPPTRAQPPLPLSAELIQTHQAGLWRYCRFLGASPSLADDLCQEAFLTWHRDPPPLREAAAAGAWLRRTARFRFLRQTRERLRLGLSEVDENELEDCWLRLAGDGAGEEYLRALRQCLAGLPEGDRELVEARYGEGRGRRELAAERDLGVEGIKSRLRRLRAELRRCVARRMDHD